MRVIAIESLKDGKLRSYGEGEYIGNLIPSIEPFKSAEIENPCIKLDNGRYVWGFQCWWGDAGEFNVNYSSRITETEIVEIEDDIQPVEKSFDI